MSYFNCLSLYEDIYGANGELSRGEIIRNNASQLCDYVHESLVEDGWCEGGPHGHVSQELKEKIARMISVGMLAMHEFDVEMEHSVIENLSQEGLRFLQQEMAKTVRPA